MKYKFIGGPFDGEHEGTSKINFFDGLILELTKNGTVYKYAWKEGITFEYSGVGGGERAEPVHNTPSFTKE